MEIAFSIHQDLWHEAWVAATSAVRSRKRQVDLDVEARVRRLIEDHGPRSGAPLSLRVYGTMLKGFCVINNERARTLYSECERVVILFSQRPSGTEGEGGSLKLPAAKRQRVDALTLDLDLATVREAETFDWTQTPLEEGVFLQIPGTQDLATQPYDDLLAAGEATDQVGLLLDESFPALEGSAVAQVDAVAQAMLAADAVAAQALGQEADGQQQPIEQQALAECSEAPKADEQQLAKRVRRRPFFPRGLVPVPGPGQVHGFDEEPVMCGEAFDQWQAATCDIDCPRRSLLQHAELVQDGLVTLDRHGHLRALFWPPLEFMAGASTEAGPLRLMEHALVLPPQQQAKDSVPAQANKVDSAKEKGEATEKTHDPFRPYVPDAPLLALEDVNAELVNALVVQGTADTESASSAGYDGPTARVCTILRRCMEEAETTAAGRPLTFDDVAPPCKTDKASAARMFAAVLTLATAGELTVCQGMEYGPIEIISR